MTAVPNAVVELERIVPTDGSVFPYIWVRGADRVDVTAALEASAPTETFTLVDDVADRLRRGHRNLLAQLLCAGGRSTDRASPFATD